MSASYRCPHHPSEPIRWLIGAKGEVTLPGPSPAEEAATNTQTEILKEQLAISKQQQAFGNAALPITLTQAGYNMKEVPEGTPNAFALGGKSYTLEQDPGAKSLQDLNTEIATASGKRTLAGLKGEIPVDPAVENDLRRSQQEMRETLLRRLGPGWETSEPGIRAMNEFGRRVDAIRYSVRTGELGTANAISLNQQQELMAKQNQLISNLQRSTAPITASAEILGGAGQTAGQIVQQGQAQRFKSADLQLGQSMAKSQAIGGAVGGITSASITAAAIY